MTGLILGGAIAATTLGAAGYLWWAFGRPVAPLGAVAIGLGVAAAAVVAPVPVGLVVGGVCAAALAIQLLEGGLQ
ncbi:MAG: hypothetical protein ACRCU1_18595 [Alsobacter sp.]